MNEASAAPETSPSRLASIEDRFSLLILAVMAFLPLLEMVARPFAGAAIPGSQQYVSMLTLWAGFAGAMLAAREDRHLAMSTGIDRIKGKAGLAIRFFAAWVACVVTAVLARGALESVLAEMESTVTLPGGVPAWLVQAIMPIAYAAIAIRIIWIKFDRWRERGPLFALAALVLAGAAVAGEGLAAWLRWPGIVLVIAATVLGAPIYVALGGAALVLFWADGTPIASVAAETVRQVASPTMPTIPLFTFAGYLLAESQTSTRLVRVMRALVGWLPGGAAIITAAVCAFFTTFTGASGVTILALGGLLLPILVKARYPEGFSIGLLTASGSIGLLFPPSLPVIFYGVIAGVPVDQLYVAGLLPGLVLVAAVAAFGARVGAKHGADRVPFELREAGAALWEAKWELMLPLIVISSIAFGWTTLVEAAALTAAYALFIEVVIYKDLGIRADLPRVARECSVLIGGVLIILGVAMGFTSYLVDAEIPARGLELVRGEISSRWVFLAVLNLFLLAVGCLMDIYSAVVVVVPLILPIAEHFGVHPIHLGIIFLANLELGFLTPPVGMNLFLSAYRFDKPVMEVARRALPFLLVLILAVLLITYLPSLTLAPVEWLFGPGALAPQEIDL